MDFHEFAFVDGTFINVKGVNPFAPDRFAKMCALMEKQLPHIEGMLAFALGNRLSTEQRRALGAMFAAGGFPVAVITEAKETRGSVTALTWDADINIRSFGNVDDALAFLDGVTPRARAEFDRLIADLRRSQLG